MRQLGSWESGSYIGWVWGGEKGAEGQMITRGRQGEREVSGGSEI